MRIPNMSLKFSNVSVNETTMQKIRSVHKKSVDVHEAAILLMSQRNVGTYVVQPVGTSVAEPELFFAAPAPTFQKAPAPAPVLHAIRYFMTKENGISRQ